MRNDILHSLASTYIHRGVACQDGGLDSRNVKGEYAAYGEIWRSSQGEAPNQTSCDSVNCDPTHHHTIRLVSNQVDIIIINDLK